MTNEVRYGVGSLEEEIRKVRGMVAEGHEFSTQVGVEPLDEATKNTVMLKRQGSMSVEEATFTMKVKNGTITFNVKYASGGGKNDIPFKEFGRLIGALK